MWDPNEAAQSGGPATRPESTVGDVQSAAPLAASESTSPARKDAGASSSDAPSAGGFDTTSGKTVDPFSPSQYDGKVWSPSQTQDWSRCPLMWDLSRRWERFGGNSWSPERVTGDAIHAGLASLMRSLQADPTLELPKGLTIATDVALQFLKEEWPEDAPMEYAVEGVQGVVTKALKEFVKQAPDFLAGKKIVSVEHDFGDSIADLITMDIEGQWLEVTDWKYSASVQPQYIPSRLDDTEVTHQFFHYAWRAQQTWGRPVKFVRKVLIVGAPKTTVKQREVEIDPKRMRRWEQSTFQVWDIMSKMRNGEMAIHERLEGCRMFGGCSFYDGCHRLMGDETKFDRLYKEKVWTPRRKR